MARFRSAPTRGQFALLVGAPGVGKSTFALIWAIEQWRPVAIVSHDTDLYTQARRIERYLSHTRRSLEIGHLFLTDGPATPQEIDEMVVGLEEYYGDPPVMLVLDNLGDIVPEESVSAYEQVIKGLRSIAHSRKVFVVALHHTRRGSSDDMVGTGRVPLTLRDAAYAGEKRADLVLGLWRPSQDELRVSLLKRRDGLADPSGHLWVRLRIDMENAHIGEM
jgi:hypothetical protein